MPDGMSDGAGRGAVSGETRRRAVSPVVDDPTLSDSDQSRADADQTSSDRDQDAADRDQAASDSDQAASDRDLLVGGDPDAHRISRDARERGAQLRHRSATERVSTAAVRDAVAHERDLAAAARDQAAAARDDALAVWDRELAALDTPGRGAPRTAQHRERAAAARAAAADVRARAGVDRDLAALDRGQAAEDRAQANGDREALLGEIVEDLARERALMTRLAERSALLELAPDPIFARDADGRITFWNTAAERAYGFSSQEALGARPHDLLRTEYPIALEDIERRVGEDGLWEGDLVQTAKDGRRLTVASRWGAVHDGDGNLTGLLEVNRDITQRLEAQAQREHSQSQQERVRLSRRLVRAQRLESLGELAGGIAHDFNNLLAVILGYSDIVAARLDRTRDRLLDEDFAFLSAGVTEITRASQRAAALTHQLLSFAQQDVVRFAVIDVNATIGDTLQLLGRTLGTHIELTASLDPDLDRVRIDPGQLGQILVNLAVNSRDAMPDGGCLSITTTRLASDNARPPTERVLAAGRYVRLDVTDTGAGMPREVIDRAFDPFFTTKPVGEGTGLGLAGVYGIATRAGGQVELFSEPGVGTTITILLPGTDAPLTAQDTPEAAAAAPPTIPRTVLVVEDEPALRTITAQIVADAGYAVLTATGSSDALALAQAADQPIDLLLTDVVMPGLLGPQLAEQLLRSRPSMKVLFMSGFARRTLERADRPLPGAMMQKPFTGRELLTSIAQLLPDPATAAGPGP
jgi:two-component system cell cycle sensor histidine kinase/response regulator CckA